MNKALDKELKELLSLDPAAVLSRNRAKFDEVAGSFANSIVLVGSGEVGRKALAGLRKLGIEPHAFADNNSKLWGKAVDGLAVLAPQEAAQRFGTRAVFVVTIYNGSRVRSQMRELQCPTVAPYALLFWKYPEVFLPHGGLALPETIIGAADVVRSGFFLWADAASQKEYLAQLRWRLTLDFDALPAPLPAEETYYPADLIVPLAGEVFVDCGAFDGDSVRNFVERRNSAFGKIVAIEADPANYLMLQKTIKTMPPDVRDRIVTRQLAVGKHAGRIRFRSTGTAGSSIAEGGEVEVLCSRLDDILESDVPTYIKMDIEGAEMDALAGSERTIKRESAAWAICGYHTQDHLWKIPQFIRALSKDYVFYLRRYAEECWELICYAVPKRRVASASHLFS